MKTLYDFIPNLCSIKGHEVNPIDYTALEDLAKSAGKNVGEFETEHVGCTFAVKITDKHVTHVYIDHNTEMSVIPKSINKLAYLRHLNLFDNNISEIPFELCLLVSLEYLDLACNKIKYVPMNFGGLLNLKKVLLNHNNITEISESFTQLGSLEKVSLFDNPIMENLPEWLSKFISGKVYY